MYTRPDLAREPHLDSDAAPKASNRSTTSAPPGAGVKREALLVLLVVAVAFVGFGFLLEAGKMPFSKHSDLVATHLSLKYAAWQGLESGEGLPLWRRDMISGGPALTHPQAVYLHPLQWPYLFMHPAHASGLSYWLHFLCMGLSMLVLGSVLGLSPFARMFVAIAGMFSFKGIAIAHAGWLPVLPGYVSAPLLIAGVLRVMERRDLLGLALLAAAGSLALLSGHLQIPYYLVLFLAAYLSWWGIQRVRASAVREAVIGFALAAGAACVALATAGYVLLPFAYELDLLARSTGDYGFLQSEGAYAPHKLLTFFAPEALGTPLDDSYPDVSLWEDVAYFGALPQLLALFAAFAAWKRRHAPFLVVSFVLSIVLVFDSFLLRALFDWAPGFSLFRHPGRFLFLTTLFGVALSGMGVDALIERFTAGNGDAKPSRIPAIVAGILFAVTMYEGATLARRYLATAPIEQVVPTKTGFADFFAGDDEIYRVAPLQRAAIHYGWAAFYDLEFPTGFEPHNYSHYQQYMNLLVSGRVVEPEPIVWMDLPRIRRWDLLEAMGVRYLVSTREVAKLREGVSLRSRLPDQPAFAFYEGMGTATLFIYEVAGARDRGVWAREVVSVADGAEAFRALANHDVGRTTVVEVGAGPALQVPIPDAGDTLALASLGTQSIEFDAVSAAGGFAVVSEVWHPGWSAGLDGEPTRVLRTNGAFLGVEVPPGSHTLSLSFSPPGFGPGWTLTLGGAGVLLILGVLCVFSLRARASQ